MRPDLHAHEWSGGANLNAPLAGRRGQNPETPWRPRGLHCSSDARRGSRAPRGASTTCLPGESSGSPSHALGARVSGPWKWVAVSVVDLGRPWPDRHPPRARLLPRRHTDRLRRPSDRPLPSFLAEHSSLLQCAPGRRARRVLVADARLVSGSHRDAGNPGTAIGPPCFLCSVIGRSRPPRRVTDS